MKKASHISAEDVAHVAKLSNLPLTPQQIKTYQPQLDSVIGLVETIDSLDTADVVRADIKAETENVWREDKITPERTLTQEQATSSAKQTYKGYVVVPALINS